MPRCLSELCALGLDLRGLRLLFTNQVTIFCLGLPVITCDPSSLSQSCSVVAFVLTFIHHHLPLGTPLGPTLGLFLSPLSGEDPGGAYVSPSSPPQQAPGVHFS